MLETIFLKLLELSMQAGFFILAILLIRLCFKRLPKRYVCLLWALVALRLICPAQMTSPFSLIPDWNFAEDVSTPGVESTYIERLPMVSQGEVTDTYSEKLPNQGDALSGYAEMLPAQGNVTLDSSEKFPAQESGQNKLPAEPNPSTTLPTTSSGQPTKTPADFSHPMTIIWSVGLTLFVAYGLFSYLHTKHSLRQAVHGEDDIWYSEHIPSPFVMGYVKPRVYVPFTTSDEQLPYIMAHERAHISRGDHISKLLGYLLLCVYWFNPIIWLGYFTFCKDLELACDERVIAGLDSAGKKAYSEALLCCSAPTRTLLQSPLAFSEVGVKERIVNILNYKKPSFWLLAAAALACVIAALCFLTSPEMEDPENSGTEDTETTESAPWSEPIAHFDDYPEMLSALRDELTTLSGDGMEFYTCPGGGFDYITPINEMSTYHVYFYGFKEDMNYEVHRATLTQLRTGTGYDVYAKEFFSMENIPTAEHFAEYPMLYFHQDLLGTFEYDETLGEPVGPDIPLKNHIIGHYVNDGAYVNLGDDFALFAPDTALTALLPLTGGTTEVFPGEDDLHKLVVYTFADGSQLAFTMVTTGPDSTLGGNAFWFPKSYVQKNPTSAIEAKKTEIYTLQATAQDLTQAKDGFSDATDFLDTLPDVYSPDLFCRVAESADGDVILYGLRNCNALILQDGDRLYPIFMRWYLNRDILPEVYESDYDGDGDMEYAIYSLENSGSECEIMRLTMLEVVGDSLVMEIYDNNRLEQALRTTDAEGNTLTPGSFVYFQERDGQWWVRTSIRVTGKEETIHDYSFDTMLEAPLTYYDHHVNENRYFDTGMVRLVSRTPLISETLYNQDVLTLYADQFAALPGTCTLDEAGRLWLHMGTTDYECVPVKDGLGNTVYHWTTRTPSKAYPLEIVDGRVQEIPAQVLSEKELTEYSFGQALLQTTYIMYPYGIKQYILRDNGTIYVNIGYNTEDFLNLQYLIFRVSAESGTADLIDYGQGYYLLQANDTASLQAFRDSFTGAGKLIPADSSHLPWTWLLTMQGEDTSKPALQAQTIPQIVHSFNFEEFAHQNLYHWYNGFVAAELWQDGSYLTEFRYQDGTDDIVLLTNPQDRVTSITVSGVSKPLPSDILSIYYGIGGSYGIPHFLDVTSDGIKELIFEEGYRFDNSCAVYDLDTMEQLTFDTDIAGLMEMLTITLEDYTFTEDSTNVLWNLALDGYQVTSEQSLNNTLDKYPELLDPDITKEQVEKIFQLYTDEEIHHISYDTERGCFKATSHILCHTFFMEQVIGTLYADYVWDADARMFVLDLDTAQLRAAY